jgi:hypothetical protein
MANRKASLCMSSPVGDGINVVDLDLDNLLAGVLASIDADCRQLVGGDTTACL